MPLNLKEFLTRKKKELEIVIEDIVADDDDTAVFIGEGTEDDYQDQLIADNGLAGIFGIKRGNNAP